MEEGLVATSESLHSLQQAAAAQAAAEAAAQAEAEAQAEARTHTPVASESEHEHTQETYAALHHPQAQLHPGAQHLDEQPHHPHHHAEEGGGNGSSEPALQAEETLMELPEGADTKRCAACRVVKPVTEYYKDRTHSRGIKTRCKQCLRACKEAFKNQQRAKSAAEQVTVVSKKCSHCGQEKPAAEFSRSSYQRTGLRSWCKECSSKSKKQAKAEGRWKSYDSKAKQPRKCRKCEEIRQPEEFPIDPRNPTKRTRDCAYCLEAAVGGGQLSLGALAQAGADGANPMAMGAWGPHLGEYWHMDPARAHQLQGLAQAEVYSHNPPASESLMRILRAAMAGTGEEPRRMTPELLSQLGVYADPNDPFSELPPDTQAAVIQQFVDQQQQRHNSALLQAHPGFPPEVLYQRDGSGLAFPPGQRPPDAHLMQFAEQQREAAAQEHAEARLATQEAGPLRPEASVQQAEVPEGHEVKEHQGQSVGVGHFEQPRNLPYNTEGWQPHHLQHPAIQGHPDWPSAFAPAHRQLTGEAAGAESPKRAT